MFDIVSDEDGAKNLTCFNLFQLYRTNKNLFSAGAKGRKNIGKQLVALDMQFRHCY